MKIETERKKDSLGQGVWAAFPQRHKGVATLRSRLSQILTNQILKQLPALLHNVETELKECKLSLDKLGPSRATIETQRSYLVHASYRFATLIKEATGGLYDDAFFGSARDQAGYKKRLRAVVQNTLTEFAETMRLEGYARRIVETYKEVNGPRKVLRSDYLEEVKSLMRRSRGCELPGTYNPRIIGALL
jgi:hypothetical protein